MWEVSDRQGLSRMDWMMGVSWGTVRIMLSDVGRHTLKADCIPYGGPGVSAGRKQELSSKQTCIDFSSLGCRPFCLTRSP